MRFESQLADILIKNTFHVFGNSYLKTRSQTNESNDIPQMLKFPLFFIGCVSDCNSRASH